MQGAEGELKFSFSQVVWISVWSFLLTKPLILFSAYLLKYPERHVKDPHERKKKYDLPKSIKDVENQQVVQIVKTRTRGETICYWFGVSLLVGFMCKSNKN